MIPATIVRGDEPLFSEARIALDPIERMVGLLTRTELAADEALIFPRCRSLHTFFMRFAIDIIFLGREGDVVRLYLSVPAGRIVFGGRGSYSAIECGPGIAHSRGIEVGQRITWIAS